MSDALAGMMAVGALVLLTVGAIVILKLVGVGRDRGK
jgi:hypothetical protein